MINWLSMQYVARHYKNGINVGYMAHPSFVDEEELEGFKAPLSISAAETDASKLPPLPLPEL